MVSNGYLDSTIQKGFMRDVSGCVEHSETIYRAALDARTHGRDLCTSWIDVANAYGSVKHSLIHFSLEWYHVPEHFCELKQASIPPLSTSHCWRKSADFDSGIKAHRCFVCWSQDMRIILDY